MKKKIVPPIESYLSRYQDGELSPEETKMVEAYLQSTPGLSSSLDALRETSASLRQTFSEIEPMNNTTTRLQNYLNILPSIPRPQSDFWGWGRLQSFFELPKKKQIVIASVTFILFAILTVPTLILPNSGIVHPRPKVANSEEQDIQKERYSERRQIATSQQSPDHKNYSEKYVDVDGDGDGVREQLVLGDVPYLGTAFHAPNYGARLSTDTIKKMPSLVSRNEKDSQRLHGKNTDMVNGAIVLGMAGMPENAEADKAPQEEIKTNSESATEARKIIRNGNMQIEVEMLNKAQESVERVVAEAQGIIAQFSLHEKDEPPWAQYTLWIPAEKLDSVIETLNPLGDMQQLELQAGDISEAYFDQDTRIHNLQRQEERLLKLYERDTVKMEDLLKVEQEIARIRTTIEQLQGQQRMWDRQVQYSTLTLNLRQKPEEKPIVQSEPNDVFTPVRRALQDAVALILYSCSLITTMIAWVFSFAMFVIPWMVIIGLIWFVKKRVGIK